MEVKFRWRKISGHSYGAFEIEGVFVILEKKYCVLKMKWTFLITLLLFVVVWDISKS